YHADPRFPRALACRRFGAWMERALDEASPRTRVSVVGPAGKPSGFAHTELDGEVGDVRRVAADPEAGALAGPALLAGALRDLASRGAGRATARLSAANVAALNL